MTTYTVIQGDTLQSLIDQVNRLRDDGWVCQGGICYTTVYYCQAMVKQ